MNAPESGLDFEVIDRARSLGELLALLFTLSQLWKPKAIADALYEFDPRQVIEPNTVGRWLRDERRPSKPHLQLIIRFFQQQGLVGPRVTTDRVFVRIAAHLAGIGPAEEVQPQIAPARRASTPYPRIPLPEPYTEAGAARALAQDLANAAPDWEGFTVVPTLRERLDQIRDQRESAPVPVADIRSPDKRAPRVGILRRIFRAFWIDR